MSIWVKLRLRALSAKILTDVVFSQQQFLSLFWRENSHIISVFDFLFLFTIISLFYLTYFLFSCVSLNIAWCYNNHHLSWFLSFVFATLLLILLPTAPVLIEVHEGQVVLYPNQIGLCVCWYLLIYIFFFSFLPLLFFLFLFFF